MTLPEVAENDRLEVVNDKLEREIARLQGSAFSSERLTIDQYLLERSSEAVATGIALAHIYSAHGSPALQAAMVDPEARFDNSTKRCSHRPDDEGGDSANLEEARAACVELEAIHRTVADTHVPSAGEWPSVFKEDLDYKTRVGYTMFLADSSHLRHDQATALVPKVKKSIIAGDKIVIQADRSVWLTDIAEQDTMTFNKRHPEQPLADMADTLQMVLDNRQRFAKATDTFRDEILAATSRRQR